MLQLYTYEFCRMTKLHIDEMLSTNPQTDVTLIIETMHFTIEFENELHRQFDSANSKIRSQIQIVDGKATVEASGTADDIRAKYRPSEIDEDALNQEAFKKLQSQKSVVKGLTKLQPRIFEFRGCIS